MPQITSNLQLDIIESDCHAISIENMIFTVFSITQNHVVSDWYYQMPFFSNVKTKVCGELSVESSQSSKLDALQSDSLTV